MGCTCSSKKDQSPNKTTQSAQYASAQLFVIAEAKIQKFYRPHQQLQNISNSTILTRRRINTKITDLKCQKTK
ncbi:unnamed protein product [Paramecium pentaurelia]|uniref:Uncharacterized protein n=1 Tax=Paramecium pentaurelia TaxID=43138 RepID=A0A8S1S3E0_9CILI|nr:unnamed protein product [Paramecium pentaurelia]